MEIKLFQRIQGNILEKRQNLMEWLANAPAAQKQIQLGLESEQAVQTHLDVLDTTLEKIEDQSLGLCEVCHDYVNSSLLEMDYTSCICLEHFSDLERRKLEAELEFVQVVQRALFPQQTPNIPGLDVAAFCRPAQIVAGDYFDFFRFRDGAHGMVIADAMGHGVSASLLMSSLQTALRTLVPENDSPAEILRRINQLFLHNANITTFVTVLLCRFDPTSRLLTYCNAGHNPALLYQKREDSVAWLQPKAAAVGIVEDYEPEAETLTLGEGDILVLYTDGVTEATNPQGVAFGRDGLAEVVIQNADLPAVDLLQSVRQALQVFTGVQPLEDDVTIVVSRIGSSSRE